jgi:adenylosuccinate synthase
VGPGAVRSVTGIVKAYCTRVGAGPFPSELDDATGERLRTAGREFGVVTGRARRCGWFDAVAARYAIRLNGLDRLIMTKLDVLSGFETIGVVTGYRHADGTPAGAGAMGEPGLTADIVEHPGWREDIRDVRAIKNLPAAARSYIDLVTNLCGVPVALVSVGPERSAFAVM